MPPLHGRYVCVESTECIKGKSTLERCGSTPTETRVIVSSSSQAAKKQKTASSSISTSETGCLSNETPSDVASKTKSNQNETSKSSALIIKLTQPQWLKTTMLRVTADNSIMAQVEAALTRFEPPAHICDPSVQNALAAFCGTGIPMRIPAPTTIFDRYVLKIDAIVSKFIID
jgi:hypothetical protein